VIAIAWLSLLEARRWQGQVLPDVGSDPPMGKPRWWNRPATGRELGRVGLTGVEDVMASAAR